MMTEVQGFISIFLVVICICAGDTNNTSIIGDMNILKTVIELNCFNNFLDDVSFPTFKQTIIMPYITFIDCLPSQLSYKTVLMKLNVKLASITKLRILVSNISPIRFDEKHFEGLTIETLDIVSLVKNKPMQLESTDFLNPLKNLTEFTNGGVDFPPLPAKSPLQILELYRGRSIGEIGGCTQMRQLILLEWDIEQSPRRWLQNCSELRSIDLFRMINFSMDHLQKIVEGVNNLQQLQITDSDLSNFQIDVFTDIKRLKDLKIRSVNFNNMLLRDMKFNVLQRLYFINCNIIELQGLPYVQFPSLTLYLQSNIKSWSFNKPDYEMLKQVSVIVSGDNLKLNCHCQHGWLARAVREGRLTTTLTIECKDGTNIVDTPREVLECDRFECSDCTCQRQWSDNSTVARCGGTATRMPRVRGLRALHAAGNRIETLSAEDLPDTLLQIDLSRNRLSSINMDTVVALFSITERRVRLADNPLACHCGNKDLIEMLHTYKNQVEDYDKLWCITGIRRHRIHEVIPSELCAAELLLKQQVGLYVTLSVCAVLLGLTAITGVLYCRYKQHIKVYLYAHGYCLWCLQEEEVDSGRRYDAFLSFSHSDEEFVFNEILPRLDSEYKLCLHFRDWVVGEFIPAQITRSVEQSRRTIIVLSKNFVQSVWGLLEFRTAHTNALSEGRARIIVILLDDVINDEGLAPELRSYIRTNTYVRWGDKWFWEKLRYAMPHRVSTTTEPEPVTIEPLREPLDVPLQGTGVSSK